MYDIFLCVRDNSDTLLDTFKCFEECEKAGFEFTYYIYENDSVDETAKIVTNFMKNKKGIFKSDKLNTKKFNHVTSKDRIKNMVLYRNNCKNLCNNFNKYAIVIDTNITFSIETLLKIKNVLDDDEYNVCGCAYGIDENNKYYDVYAFKSLRNKKNIDYSTGSFINVNSAFGGICIIRSYAYHKCHYGIPMNNEDNEHVFLCHELQKYGNIIIVKQALCTWKRD
uniref:Glycosyltransferase 2-like domain-containing protein n=1 Tax=viral metagenome TaxID=1070528 RepID=A0A6C0F5T2_9ZZZZ|tara:strand:- start:15750 stop:16421 length:672 start_codon:yes stop_codon:yes gene_type:complete